MDKYPFYPFNNSSKKLIDENKCVLEIRGSHLCGYVALPKEVVPKEWWGDYTADALQYLAVHGGLTYCKAEGDCVVFGFDCAHCDDGENPKLKQLSYVMELTQDMEHLLIAYSKVIHKWRNACSRKKRANMIDKINLLVKHKQELGFGAMLGMLGGGKEFGVEDR